MTERLEKICLVPPPTATPWSNGADKACGLEISRRDGKVVQLDVPLFWYDPPWYQIGTDTADLIATATARLGVAVTALRSDLCGPDQQSELHGDESDDDEDEGEPEAIDSTPLPRIVPYRPERYGVCDRDFDEATIIDVRLVKHRDPTGRFAYPAEQVERWEAAQPHAQLESGIPVPSTSFPPDVVSMEHLAAKLEQLRALAPTAAVFVSVGAHRLEFELPGIVAAKPDGLILRLDDLELDGLKLATATRHARELLDRSEPGLPLCVVPGEISADDAVKLCALGASAVAIDSWCAEIIDAAEDDNQSAGGYSYSFKRSSDALIELVEDGLSTKIERFQGLLSSLQHVAAGERLAGSSESWARALGLPFLALLGAGHHSAKHRKQ